MDLVKLLSSVAEARSFSNQSLELVYGLQAVKKVQSLIGNSCPRLMTNVTIQPLAIDSWLNQPSTIG